MEAHSYACFIPWGVEAYETCACLHRLAAPWKPQRLHREIAVQKGGVPRKVAGGADRHLCAAHRSGWSSQGQRGMRHAIAPFVGLDVPLR